MTERLVGTVLDGRYRIDAALARGGMSVVYAGTDLRLDRPVAVKVMSESLAGSAEFTERFTREARAAARLSHPNVVAVFDQGSDQGLTFLVMELVRGWTLRQLLQNGAVEAATALNLLEPILAALAAAHRAGLVHRDVKPENVLISADGVVKVADFGLARAISHAATSQTSVVMGTVAYVAPEQVSRGTADARSDVYAAGIVLYELLTGSPPYRGDHAVSVAYRHVHEDVPPPSRSTPAVPAALDALTVRATSRDPNARPTDAAAFLAELRAVRQALRLPVAPVPTPQRHGAHGATTAADAPPRRTAALGASPPPPAGVGATAPPPRGTAIPMAHGTAIPTVRSTAAPSRYDEQLRYRRRHRIGLASVLAVGLLAASLGWWFGSGRWEAVPAVAGLGKQPAVAALTAAGFRVEVGYPIYDDDHRAGTVARTDPVAGRQLIRGRAVTVQLSLGRLPDQLPDVAGEPGGAAEAALASLGATVTVSGVPNNSVPADHVVSTFPAAGSPVAAKMAVTVYLSSGAGQVRLPDVRGDSPDDATRALRELGLTVSGREQRASDTVDAGSVVDTAPEAGSTVPGGAAVRLVLSSGPEAVAVPMVIGLSRDAAMQRLREAGFTVRVTGLLGQKRGTVFSQSPAPTTRQPPGSTVTIGLL